MYEMVEAGYSVTLVVAFVPAGLRHLLEKSIDAGGDFRHRHWRGCLDHGEYSSMSKRARNFGGVCHRNCMVSPLPWQG